MADPTPVRAPAPSTGRSRGGSWDDAPPVSGNVVRPTNGTQSTQSVWERLARGMQTAQGGLAVPSLVQEIADYYGIDPQLLGQMMATSPGDWVNLVENYRKEISGTGGSGGGASRFLFPEEQRQLELQNAALERELELSRQGSSRFENFNGVLFDPLTGDIYDPTTGGLERSKFDFESGPQFNELIRQFDVGEQTTRRGQDITQRGQDLTYDLGVRGEDRLNRQQGIDAQMDFANLGMDKARFFTDLLRSPSDAISRLAMQRGGVSPLEKITQADLMNSVNSMFSNTSQVGAPPPRVPQQTPQYQDIYQYEEGTEGGPVRSKLSVVGEAGPELLINHGDGSFDVVSNEDSKLLGGLMDWITRPGSKRTSIKDERKKAGAGAGGGGGGSWGKEDVLRSKLSSRDIPDEELQALVGSMSPHGGMWSKMDDAGRAAFAAKKGVEVPKAAPSKLKDPIGNARQMVADVEFELKALKNMHKEGLPSWLIKDLAFKGISVENLPVYIERQTERLDLLKDNLLRMSGMDDFFEHNVDKIPSDIPGYAGGTIDFFNTGGSRFAPPPSPYKPNGGVDQGLVDEWNAYQNGDRYGGTQETPRITQSDLVGYAREATSPGGQSFLAGKTPDAFGIPGLPTPTAMNFARLSGAERENLNSRLAVEFNSTLEDLMFAIQQRYGTNNERRARYLT